MAKTSKKHWHVSVVNTKSEKKCSVLQNDHALLFIGLPSTFMHRSSMMITISTTLIMVHLSLVLLH